MNFNLVEMYKCYFIGDQANTDGVITEFDFRFGPYFVPNKVRTNKKAGYNSRKGSNDESVRVLLLGSCAFNGSLVKSGSFDSRFVRSNSSTGVGFFTTIKLD